MNKYLRGGLSVVACALAFYGTQSLMDRWRGPEPSAQAAVAKEVASIQAQAEKQHPSMAKSDAMKEVASERAADKFATQSPLERSHTAADMFWGFYWLNTKVRPEYCAERGVDLAGFVQAFDRIHGKELARAKEIYEARGIDAEKSVMPILLPELRKFVVQDMKDVAEGAKAPKDQACDLVAANAEAVAQFIQLPPHVQKALFGER